MLYDGLHEVGDRIEVDRMHFKQGKEAIEAEFGSAPRDIRTRLRWLPIGVATDLAA